MMLWFRRIGILSVGLLCSCAIVRMMIYQSVAVSPAFQEAQAGMIFPYSMSDQPIVIHGIYGYEGPYVEDGTDREVCDIASLVVENVSQNILMDTWIAVYSQNQSFIFFAQCLPAGEKTLVLEKEEKLYFGESAISCWAHTNIVMHKSQPCVQIQQIDRDVLEIVSQSQEQISSLVIYHKNWSKEIDAYLGGVVYKTYLYHVKPGQLFLVRPGHYTKSVSKIICAVS